MSKYKIIIFSILVFFASSSLIAHAKTTATTGAVKKTCDPDQTCIESPLGETIGDKPELIIGTIINGIMGIVGSLALLMFVYGGITWMLAAGDSGRVQKGKDILTWATIGLIVIFASYGLVKFVIDVIAGNNIT